MLPMLAVLSLALAPAPFPRPPRKPMPAASLQGQWEGAHLLVITPGRATYHHGHLREYDLSVDASAVPPAYEMRGTGNIAGRVLRGIFKVEGDTLILCYHSAGRERPAAFEGPGKGTYTAVYRRKKP
jgi:uncharacterized protein (TIGR03067 family)